MEDILHEFDEKLQESASYRANKEQKFKEAERFYAGKHWKAQVNRPYKNYIFSTIEGEVPILVDGSPASSLIAKKSKDQDRIKILAEGVKYVYQKNNIELRNSELARELLKIGTGFLYVDYDPFADDGEGLPIHRTLSWKNCFPDPLAKDIDSCQYFIIREALNEELVRKKYGIDEETELPETTCELAPNGDVNIIGTDGKKPYAPIYDVFDDSLGKSKKIEMCVVDEMWIKDYTREEIPEDDTTLEISKEAEQFMNMIPPKVVEEMDHDQHIKAHDDLIKILVSEALQIDFEVVTDQDIQNMQADEKLGVILQMVKDHKAAHEEMKKVNPKGTRSKYKKDLRLLIKVGDYIIYDDSAPVDDGLIPVVPFYCYKDAHDFWGIGEADNLIPIQKTINELEWSELKALKLCSNPGWLVDNNSGVDETTLTNEEGIVVPKKPGTEVTRFPPGQVSPQLGIRVNSDRASMEAISGVNDVSQGRISGSITAASAIENLKQSSLTRMRLKQKLFWEYSHPRLMKLTVSRILKYFTNERELRIWDKDGQIKYVKYNPNDFYDLEYDFLTIPDTTSQMDKQQIYSLMTDLLARGVVDAKTVVETTDLPNKQKILENIEANNVLNQQLQALAEENAILKQGVTMTNPQNMGE